MDLNLNGRRALVTGSSSGLGAAIAELLAAEGADVVVHGRDEARTREVAEKIGAVAVAIGDLATDDGADAVARVAGSPTSWSTTPVRTSTSAGPRPPRRSGCARTRSTWSRVSV